MKNDIEIKIKDMNKNDDIDLDYVKEFIKLYFKRLSSFLSTQVPDQVRKILLPEYMLYKNFKGTLYLDYSGRLALEVHRKRGSRISIKLKKVTNRVEENVFCTLGDSNIFFLSGRNIKLKNLVLTCKEFTEKYRYKLPQHATILIFNKKGKIGPVELGAEADAKVIDCKIYWVVGNRPCVKHIPFVWLIGNKDLLTNIDPALNAESDFYSSLFGSLYALASQGYTSLDEATQSIIFDFYTKLIDVVESEIRDNITITQADEEVFQRLLGKYMFFLCPDALYIEYKPKIQRYQADFGICLSQEKYIYVEIEPPFYKPFIGSKKSSRLNMALKQIENWKKVLANQNTTRDIEYMIIIGLLEDMNEDEKRALAEFNKNQKDLVVRTWDFILENIRKTKLRLNELKKAFS